MRSFKETHFFLHSIRFNTKKPVAVAFELVKVFFKEKLVCEGWIFVE